MLAVILLLVVACFALAVPVAVLAPQWLVAPVLLVAVAVFLLLYHRQRLTHFVAKQLSATKLEGSRVQASLADLALPTFLVADGRIL